MKNIIYWATTIWIITLIVTIFINNKKNNKTQLEIRNAISKWDIDKIKEILKKWININKFFNNRTILMDAAIKWDINIINLLLNNNPDVNLKCIITWFTALDLAVLNWKSKAVLMLLSKGSKINNYTFFALRYLMDTWINEKRISCSKIDLDNIINAVYWYDIVKEVKWNIEKILSNIKTKNTN